MAMDHFDWIVVGGGKGGKTLGVKLAQSGRRVALIEKGMVGGSCINVACIPTKTMVKSAKVAELARRAEEFGILVTLHDSGVEGVRKRKRAVVSEMVARNQAMFDRSGMTFLLGTARFVGPRQLEVKLRDGQIRVVSAEHVVVNTGTRPAMPVLEGLERAKPLTSETIQELDRLPAHLLVLGGGYIGCEFAQIFRRLGSRVTLMERGPRFLPREDADVGEHVLEIFRQDGIDVLLGASPVSVEGESGRAVRVTLKTPQGEQVIEGSDLLVALGRVPNTEELNPAAAGIDLTDRGFIKVNEKLETTAAQVWALGDVNGGPQFTHASLDDFRILMANLSGGNRSTAQRLIPYTLFIDPELGRVGMTEEEARKKGFKVRVARMPASAIPRAVTAGEPRGFLKAVVDAETDRILGAAILAAEGGEVMAVLQVAMQGGVTATTLRETIFSHPSMSEGLNDLFARME